MSNIAGKPKEDFFLLGVKLKLKLNALSFLSTWFLFSAFFMLKDWFYLSYIHLRKILHHLLCLSLSFAPSLTLILYLNISWIWSLLSISMALLLLELPFFSPNECSCFLICLTALSPPSNPIHFSHYNEKNLFKL